MDRLEQTITIPQGCYATIEENKVFIRRKDRDKDSNKNKRFEWLGCDRRRLRIVNFRTVDGGIDEVYMCVGLLETPCHKGHGAQFTRNNHLKRTQK